MASEGSGNSGLAFIVGGLLVLVLVVAGFMYFGGGNMFGGNAKSVDVSINAPAVPSPAK